MRGITSHIIPITCDVIAVTSQVILVDVDLCLYGLALQLFQSPAKLIRTGSVFGATADAINTLDDIVYLLTTQQLANSLEVAIATTKEKHLLNNVVLVASHIYHA